MKSKMKKLITSLAIIAMLITAFAGCSKSNNTTENNTGAETEMNSGAESQTAEQLVNDNPIKPVKDDTKYAVEYFNRHAYTSDFSYNEAQPSWSIYWVYKEDNELRKVTLDDHMTVDGTYTVKLGDSMSEELITKYISNDEDSKYLDEILSPGADTVKLYIPLYGKTDEGDEIFSFEVKNNTSEELPVRNCAVSRFSIIYHGEPCEYMGLKKGDDIDKVIETLGSPNRELAFSSTGAHTYDIEMRYIDAENERTVFVVLELYYDGMDSEKTKAVLKYLHVYDHLEQNIAH